MIQWTLKSLSEAYRGIPKSVWFLASINFVNQVGAMVIPFLAIYLTSEVNFSAKTAGTILGLYGLGVVFGGPLGGWLSEKLDAVKAQAALLTIAAVAWTSVPFFHQFYELAGLIFLCGLFNSAFTPANSAAIGNHCPKEIRTRAFAMQRLAMNAGAAVGPAIGGFLAGVGFSLIFYVDAMTCLLAALIIMGFRSHFLSPIQPTAKKDDKDRSSLATCLTDRRFLVVLVLFVFALICFLQLKGTYTLYLKEFYELKEIKIGFLFSLNAVLVVLFEMVIAKKLEHFPRLKIAGVGYLIVGTSLAILPLGSSYGLAIFSMLLMSVGEMIGIPPTMAWISERANARTRGMYMGFFSSSIGVGMILAPIIGMSLYEISQDLLWLTMLITGVFVCLGYALLSRTDSPSTIHPSETEL